MHKVISLKYRPKDFSQLYNQEHVKLTLINALRRRKIANAYLFAGPRGIGKTTTARILAKSLNCEAGLGPNPCSKCSSCLEIASSRSPDVLEIDGASNRGIDEIRNLRENVKFRPIKGRYRVYIIDEVHMLTIEAFNALLKTLEEPPEHVVFIFATTAPHKLPKTILSRCQRFDFRKVSPQEITKRLKVISKEEGIDIEDRAIEFIAKNTDGSVRDAENILEQVSSYNDGDIKLKDVEELMGVVPERVYLELMEVIKKKDDRGIFQFVNRLSKEGFDLTEFYSGLIRFLRDLWLAKIGVSEAPFQEDIKDKAKLFEENELSNFITLLIEAEDRFKRSLAQGVYLEVLLLQARNFIKPMEETPRDIKEIWQQFLKKIDKDRPMVGNALKDADIYEVEDDKLTLLIPKNKGWSFQILEKEKEYLINMWREIVDKEIEIKVITKTEIQKSAGKKDKDEFEKKVQKIINLFNGEIIE